MKRSAMLLLLAASCSAPVGQGAPGAAAYPRAMIIPQPEDQVSFQVNGKEWLRYHTGDRSPKPYFYPVMGPAGAPVTRLTHPGDPHTHDHHLSLWVGHAEVGGANFWEARRSPARIVRDHIVKIADGDQASLTVRAKWLDGEKKPLLFDERVWTLTPRYDTIGPDGYGEYTLDLRITLTPHAPSITLGKTPFGMVSIRVAKMMGTLDGGGTIRNSEGQVNEKELMPHKRARWCDYSGRPAPDQVNGVSFLDHPSNPNHPTHYHVRGDGWMGASLTFDTELVATKEKPLVLRYRFWVHAGPGDPKLIDAEWKRWAEESR